MKKSIIRLGKITGVTMVTDNDLAKKALNVLTQYKDRVHAWDTVETCGAHNQLSMKGRKLNFATCFCGDDVDFGDGPHLWIDNSGDGQVLLQFQEYFSCQDRLKVFHNFSFDYHLLRGEDIQVRGFLADILHLARLYDSSLSGWEAEIDQKDAAILQNSKNVVSESVHLSLGDLLDRVENKNLEDIWTEKQNDTIFEHKIKNVSNKLPIGYDLKSLTLRYLPEKIHDFTHKFGDCSTSNGVKLQESLIQHATNESKYTFHLFNYFRDKLMTKEWDSQAFHQPIGGKKKNMWDFFQMYFSSFAMLLVEMEQKGIRIDTVLLEKKEKAITEQASALELKFNDWLNKWNSPKKLEKTDRIAFNHRSPNQIRTLLYGNGGGSNKDKFSRNLISTNNKSCIDISGMGLEPPKDSAPTSTGFPSTRSTILEALAGDPYEGRFGEAYNQLTDKLGDLKAKEVCFALHDLKVLKLTQRSLSLFVNPLRELLKDGRVHARLQPETSTGRLSCSQPNIHGQPSNDPFKLRELFCASPGNKLLIADYDQLELRMLAEMSKDEGMINSYKMGGDLHSETAAEMFDNVRELTSTKKKLGVLNSHEVKKNFPRERKVAKTINFGILYGLSAASLARELDVDIHEANYFMEIWFQRKTKVKSFMESVFDYARRTKSARSFLGRSRSLPHIIHVSNTWKEKSLRASFNFTIQGSAVDLMMTCMLNVWRSERMKELQFETVMQIHDELILEGPAETVCFSIYKSFRIMSVRVHAGEVIFMILFFH
eukprot:GHVL01005418.1.p1 GENE.GHVL01005418.1~~GHVL01005418.1.p1  ORF type:complete len:768 (+),score=101.48 GHVL01005418.1:1669-3972(+)